MQTEKKWYQSKTKWAAILIGIGPVIVTVGSILNGSIDFMTGIQSLAPQVGVVLAVFGVRDIPFLNKK